MGAAAAALLRRPVAFVAAVAALLVALGLTVRGTTWVTRWDADVVSWAARERTPLVVDAARLVTNLGNGFVVAVLLLVAAGLLVARGTLRPAAAALPLASLALGVVLSAVGKTIVGRPRPPVALHEVVERSSGFPSGHSTQSAAGWFALALVVTFARRRPPARRPRSPLWGAVLVVGAVGVSRVLLSVHSPTDVLAGWTLGAACAVSSVALLLARTGPGRPVGSGDSAPASGRAGSAGAAPPAPAVTGRPATRDDGPAAA